jgi:hypothetical protein
MVLDGFDKGRADSKNMIYQVFDKHSKMSLVD